MRFPEPVFAEIAADGPEQRAVVAEAVGLALLVVLENLTPLERLAFVLHDIFDAPFEDIVVASAPVIGLAPGQAVAGLVVDGLVLLLVAMSWLRARAVRS